MKLIQICEIVYQILNQRLNVDGLIYIVFALIWFVLNRFVNENVSDRTQLETIKEVQSNKNSKRVKKRTVKTKIDPKTSSTFKKVVEKNQELNHKGEKKRSSLVRRLVISKIILDKPHALKKK